MGSCHIAGEKYSPILVWLMTIFFIISSNHKPYIILVYKNPTIKKSIKSIIIFGKTLYFLNVIYASVFIIGWAKIVRMSAK